MTRWNTDWFMRLDTELARLPQHTPLERAAIRRGLAADPVAFAVVYLSDHLRARAESDAPTAPITFSEVHLDWAGIALTWANQPNAPQENRHAFIAPREMGKSTWWFLILPMWAAANGHVRFVAAFANESNLAQGHLQTFKGELDNNELLRADYPEMCTPARRQTGTTIADRQGMLHAKSGFVFAARGIDAGNLGLKVGHQRPDLVILDDVERDEAKYSPDQAVKRLGTVTDAILPLNIYARVVMVGTVTMPSSIIHQCVQAATGAQTADWITDERIQPHYYDAIAVNDDGTERSIWPQKWPLKFLQENRHTRSYAKNFRNDPMGREGAYWRAEDFHYGDLAGVTRVALFVDPAVTAGKTSDFTGLAVAGWSPTANSVVIFHAEGVRLTGAPLRAHILRLLTRNEQIRRVVVEVNQGGDLWREILHDLTVPVETHTATVAKEIRFAAALDFYQRKRVFHTVRFPVLEEQAVSFPKAPHDDVIDAAAAGVLYFLAPPPQKRVRINTQKFAA